MAGRAPRRRLAEGCRDRSAGLQQNRGCTPVVVQVDPGGHGGVPAEVRQIPGVPLRDHVPRDLLQGLAGDQDPPEVDS